MTEQTSYGGYAEVPPPQREERTEDDAPLLIGSRTRGPDERGTGSASAGGSDRGYVAAIEDQLLSPAIPRQFALAMEQEAVRIRRQRIGQTTNADDTATSQREKPFVPAPTISEVTATLFQRQSRYIAEVLRRLAGKK